MCQHECTACDGVNLSLRKEKRIKHEGTASGDRSCFGVSFLAVAFYRTTNKPVRLTRSLCAILAFEVPGDFLCGYSIHFLPLCLSLMYHTLLLCLDVGENINNSMYCISPSIALCFDHFARPIACRARD